MSDVLDECPTCGAHAGYVCRNIDGGVVAYHDSRLAAPSERETPPTPATPERTFPIQGPTPHRRIPWWLAEEAYASYSRHGTTQSLEMLAARGGFGAEEMDMFAPGWSDRLDHVKQLQAELPRGENTEHAVLDDRALRAHRDRRRSRAAHGQLDGGRTVSEYDAMVSQLTAINVPRDKAEATARARYPEEAQQRDVEAVRHANVLEKAEQLVIVKMARAIGFKVYILSQPRATKQTPGLFDLFLTMEACGFVAWWDAKRQVGGTLSTAQEAFLQECEAARIPIGYGDRHEFAAWLRRRRFTPPPVPTD